MEKEKKTIDKNSIRFTIMAVELQFFVLQYLQ